MIPPPNVTGSLHIGHALTIRCRTSSCATSGMRGKDALWQPGTDHAGIATQMVVERQLGRRAGPAAPIGRARPSSPTVWEWKAESGGTITRPVAPAGLLAGLGARTLYHGRAFTGRCAKVFVELYEQGADLPRQAVGQLGPEAADRDLRSGGRDAARSRAVSGIFAIRWPRRAAGQGRSRRGDDPARDDAGATRRWRCIAEDARYRRRDRQVRDRCRSPGGASRSSPTSTPTRNWAAAR